METEEGLQEGLLQVWCGSCPVPILFQYFESTGNLVTTIGVPSLEAACEEARELAAEGIELIEVCGAFGAEGAAAVAQAAGDKVAVGYVVHDPSQDEKFAALFG